MVNIFDCTATYLIVGLGLVQIEKFTHITLDLRAIEEEKKSANIVEASVTSKLQSRLLNSYFIVVSIAAILCCGYADYLLYHGFDEREKCFDSATHTYN